MLSITSRKQRLGLRTQLSFFADLEQAIVRAIASLNKVSGIGGQLAQLRWRLRGAGAAAGGGMMMAGGAAAKGGGMSGAANGLMMAGMAASMMAQSMEGMNEKN